MNSSVRDVGTATLIATVFFVSGVFSGEVRGRRIVRQEAAESAGVCDRLVWMGIADWQRIVGLDITKQVTCDQLHAIAEGTYNDR